MKIRKGAAARDFGCGQGGEVRASPQRAVRTDSLRRYMGRRLKEEPQISQLHRFENCETNPTLEELSKKGRKGAGVKGGNLPNEAIPVFVPLVSLWFNGKLRNEANVRERGEREKGAEKGGRRPGATVDFYETKPTPEERKKSTKRTHALGAPVQSSMFHVQSCGNLGVGTPFVGTRHTAFATSRETERSE